MALLLNTARILTRNIHLKSANNGVLFKVSTRNHLLKNCKISFFDIHNLLLRHTSQHYALEEIRFDFEMK